MKKKNTPVIFSLFAGLGFLDLGFEKAGSQVVYVNELENPFIKGFKYARKKMGIPEPKYGFHEGSVTDLLKGKDNQYLQEKVNQEKKNGSIVGFIAGPPCPDFSIAGKNRGHEGENGKLTRTYFDLISQFEPDFFLFENVKGLYRTKKHRAFFEEMKQQAVEKGYVLTERLINTLEFGVPQYRERIILLGFKRELLQELNIKVGVNETTLADGAFPWATKYIATDVFSKNWPKKTVFLEDSVISQPPDIIEELTAEHWFIKNDVDNHENSTHAFRPKAGLVRFMTVEEGDDSKKSYKRLHRWRYAPTAAYGNNEVHLHPYRARRISVAEALAIQSLPKEFALPSDMTLTDMFKGVGNGVPYVAANNIAKSILRFLEIKK